MAKKSKAGAKPIVDAIVLQKLELAFSLDCTDEEACFHADISPSTLYNYQKEHPEFLERKRHFRNNPTFKARKSAVDKLDESYSNAMDYLSRKRKQEFSPRFEMEEIGKMANIVIHLPAVESKDQWKKKAKK